jgi:hypothetical protein
MQDLCPASEEKRNERHRESTSGYSHRAHSLRKPRELAARDPFNDGCIRRMTGETLNDKDIGNTVDRFELIERNSPN